MSDQKLRDLERRWKETGSPDDEAAYLLERVRVGDLSRERLELAAYCGHEGARRAVNVPAPEKFSDWVRGLGRWGLEASCRALLEVGRALAVQCQPYDDDVLAALAALEEWIARPTLERAQAARNAAADASDQIPPDPTGNLRRVIWTAAGLAAVPYHVMSGGRTAQHAAGEVADLASTMADPSHLKRACSGALLAWCLSDRGFTAEPA